MNLVVVPPSHVCQEWERGAHQLGIAAERSCGEITGDQLKMLLTRGERTLVSAVDDRGSHGWAAVQVQQLPNIRVLYVYCIYAPGVTDLFGQLAEMAKREGCSEIRGACDEAVSRLWTRKFGATKLYNTMSIRI